MLRYLSEIIERYPKLTDESNFEGNIKTFQMLLNLTKSWTTQNNLASKTVLSFERKQLKIKLVARGLPVCPIKIAAFIILTFLHSKNKMFILELEF